MSEKQEAIERLQALELRSGGSHEMLSSIAKAIYEPTHGGWTIGACQVLRDTLVRLLSKTDTAPSGVSITDELRALFDRYTMRKDVYDELTAIADRIDAAHEEAIQREHEKAYDAGYAEGMGVANKADMRAEYLRGKNDGYDEGWDAGFASADDWLGQHEDAMAEHGWLRLPKGADGEYIHVGDELQWADDTDPSVAKVSYLQLNPDGSWYLGIRSRGLCYAPDVLSHYHAPEPDTWERIIEDAMKGADRDGSPDTYQECVAELVARCKALAGDAE